jgi:hypothetical protein
MILFVILVTFLSSSETGASNVNPGTQDLETHMLELSALRENGCNEDRRDFKLGVDTFEVDITGNRVATDEAEEGDAERTVFRRPNWVVHKSCDSQGKCEPCEIGSPGCWKPMQSRTEVSIPRGNGNSRAELWLNLECAKSERFQVPIQASAPVGGSLSFAVEARPSSWSPTARKPIDATPCYCASNPHVALMYGQPLCVQSTHPVDWQGGRSGEPEIKKNKAVKIRIMCTNLDIHYNDSSLCLGDSTAWTWAGQPNDKWKGERGKTQAVIVQATSKSRKEKWTDDRTPVGSKQYLGISPQEMGFESGPLSIITSLHRSSSSTLASVSISKFVMKVDSAYASCEDSKACLRVLTTEQGQKLRSNNALQKHCIDHHGKMPGCGNLLNGACAAWYQCLQAAGTKEHLARYLAAVQTSSGSICTSGAEQELTTKMLETAKIGGDVAQQVQVPAPLASRKEELISSATKRISYAQEEELFLFEEGTSAKQSQCLDPSTSDPEAWECNCHQAMRDECGRRGVTVHAQHSAWADCFRMLLCEKPEVCQSWKGIACKSAGEETLLQGSITSQDELGPDDLLSLLADSQHNQAKVTGGWNCA